MNNKSFQNLLFTTSVLFLLSVSVLKSQSWVSAGFVPNPGQEPSISVVSPNVVWIAGGNGDTARAFRTINGGVNWSVLPVSFMPNMIYCIVATSDDVAFAGQGIVNGNANLYKTTNGGLSWTSILQTPNNRGFFNGIVFTKNNGYLFGLAIAERIYRTSNNGVNWVELNAGVNGVSNAHNSLMLIDNNFYAFGLNNGAARVRLTTNNGSGWNTYAINVSGNYTSAIAFHSNKLYGVAATSTSLPDIARTTDGGLTWSSLNIGTGVSGECHFNWIENTNVVYIVGSNGGIKRSTNNGINWVTTPTSVTDIRHFDFVNYQNVIYGYAVSSNGNVIKLADSLLLTPVKILNTKAPLFSLGQNYPNPFNGSSKINFQISNSHSGNQIVKLIIYNSLGQALKVLVNDVIQPGSYEADFDGTDFGSGIYYYKLSVAQNGTKIFFDTKRMILIK